MPSSDKKYIYTTAWHCHYDTSVFVLSVNMTSEREKKDIHNKLLEKLAIDYLHPTIREGRYFGQFKMRAKNRLQGLRHDYDNAQKYFEELTSAGHIAVEKYDVLRELVEGIDVEIINLIDEYEKKLRSIDDSQSEKEVPMDRTSNRKHKDTSCTSSEEPDGKSTEKKLRSGESSEKII